LALSGGTVRGGLYGYTGRPPLPTRLIVGLAILKHMHGHSDEVLCERWIENPYYQLFGGEDKWPGSGEL
jgi:Transposase domain (DUF772)